MDEKFPHRADMADMVSVLDIGARLKTVYADLKYKVEPSRETALAITKLQEAIMWWNASVNAARGHEF